MSQKTSPDLNFLFSFLDNEPPDFPVDIEYLNEIRKRVSLARTIDKEEHQYVCKLTLSLSSVFLFDFVYGLVISDFVKRNGATIGF